MYLLAALPVGAFTAPIVLAVPVAAGAFLVYSVALLRRQQVRPAIEESLARFARPWVLVAIASALGLYIIEIGVALSVPTGNTFDSSVLTTYTSLLLQHHTVPLSYAPYATEKILYPQGATVWLGWAQTVYGLPPARTSVLVTPLFFALVPLSGFVFGRRMFGTDPGGAAIAMVLAWLGAGTRSVVWGSNDFVFAFPLVLLLASHSDIWIRGIPGKGDAVGFGLLLGYSAAINPVGAEWMLPALIVVGLVGRPALAGGVSRWMRRWILTLGSSLLAIVPYLYILALGWASPGFVPGSNAPPGALPTGLSNFQALAYIDPFVLLNGVFQFSTFPVIRVELALLLVVGLVLLLAFASSSAEGRHLDPFRRWALSAGITIAAWIGLLVLTNPSSSPIRKLGSLTSGDELSLWLFTVYAIVAAVPLVLAVERLTATGPLRAKMPEPWRPARHRFGRPRRQHPLPSTLGMLALVAVLVVPGVVLTSTSLAPDLEGVYGYYSNVSPADFALLDYAGSHLSGGSRVLVAPGSAAEFLPGYAPNVVLLFPMAPGWEWVNESYTLIVQELTNNTLNASGKAALATLDVQFILVTMRNTVLWPAFSPNPMLANNTTFPEEFHQADAYLFGVT